MKSYAPLLLSLALLATTGVHPLHAQEIGIATGQRAPAATVETLDGHPFDLATLAGSEPVLIEFWAVWCPSCRALAPKMKAAHARYGKRVRFVGVAVSVNESPESVRRYVRKHGTPGEQFFDRHGHATDAYDVPATSYVVLLDRTGRVVYTGLGEDQDLDAAIRKVL